MEGIIAFIKDIIVSPILATVILIVSAALIFLPDNLTGNISNSKFLADNGTWIFVAMTGSFAILFIQLITYIGKIIGQKVTESKIKTHRESILSNLTYDDKVILTPYIVNKSRSRILDGYNGNVRRLMANGILYYGSDKGALSPTWGGPPTAHFNINIGDEAYEFLLENSHLLNLTPEEIESEAQAASLRQG